MGLPAKPPGPPATRPTPRTTRPLRHPSRARKPPPNGPPSKPRGRRRQPPAWGAPAQQTARAGQERLPHFGPGGAQGHEHPEAQPGGQGYGHRRRRRTAQAGADLQDPADPGGEERPDLLRRRARMPARRLRLPARARVQLPARPRRRVRLALADPPLRSAHRRHHLRPDPAAQGRRAVLRAHQSRRHQLRAARGSPQQDLLRQPDAALSQPAASSSKPCATTSPGASWIC